MHPFLLFQVNLENEFSVNGNIWKNKIVEYDSNVISEIEKNAIPDNNTKVSDDKDSDPMMEQAIQCVVEAGQASTSLLQRRLRLGYARAGRLIDEMEPVDVYTALCEYLDYKDGKTSSSLENTKEN